MASMTRAVCLVLALAAVMVVAQPTCRTQWECIDLGGDCTDTTVIDRSCNQGLTSSTNFTTNRCTCITREPEPADTTVLGAACTASDNYSPQYIHQCTKSSVLFGRGIQPEYKWYSYSSRRVGDMCTSDYHCATPRICVEGKCRANIEIGEVCFNNSLSFSTGAFGMCGPNAFCQYRDRSTGVAYCTARIANGAACDLTDTDSCIPPSVCTEGTCQVPRLYFVPAGMKANSTSQCESNLWSNRTDKTCTDFAAMSAAALAVSGRDCTENSDCGTWPANSFSGTTQLATCQCNGDGSLNKAVCVISSAIARDTYRPSILQQNREIEIANAARLYNTGCEQSSSSYDTTTTYCRNRAGVVASKFTQQPDECAIYRTRASHGFKDCRGSYVYCGAFHTITKSVTLIVGAMMFAWLAPKSL